MRTHTLLWLALLPACAWQPAEAPPMPQPATWEQALPGHAAAWPSPEWWQAFGSEELQQLVAQAQQDSLDLALATARLEQAEARLRSAGASLWPSVGLAASGRRSDTFGSSADTVHAYGASLGASYEIDFWGGQKAGRDAARADRDATEYDRQTAVLTVTASVASTYLQVLSLRDRLRVAQMNLANAERVLAIVEARARAGAVSKLDVVQQRAQVLGQRAAIPPLQQQEREARAALALLLGRLPQGFAVAGSSLDGVQEPPVLAGLPSGLLQRRPDVRRAEMQWRAAEAARRVAHADRFPRIQLTAEAGVQSTALRDLFEGDPAWAAVLGLTQPLFEGGRLAAAEDAAAAAERERLLAWQAAVLAAFADTDVALGNAHALAEQQQWQLAQLEQAREAEAIAGIRYRNGSVDLVTVLDAQRSLYAAQDQAQQLKLARLQALVTLYRALGGGWQVSP